ncbi:glycosyltransferase family 2 protein [Poseidonocella sp. HB161398]|uniref:glycosyltransferase family 2 protein n=1 Tax=Poseidonocella sp. HB161398 TaxID=2320855 RepID=UPI001109BC9C|nr:glycosyltransferase family 2 protein [Poseidonocella sp. HB161398]
MPRFSIIVPAFNAAGTLAETLESFRAQTLADWECLIVDDGSTDATGEIIAAAARIDPRFRQVARRGRGPSAARNAAAAEADGDFLAFCDADDLWTPEKLAACAEAFADPGLDACFGRVAFYDGEETGTVSSLPAGPLEVGMLLGENPVCTMSNLAVRRAVFRATGGFDTRMVHNEDLEWLIRLAGTGHRAEGIDAVLVKYRNSPTGLSSELARMRAGREAALRSAAELGFRPRRKDEAVHFRYLARRALRIDAPNGEALRLALRGFFASPAGFLSEPRRGLLTLSGALLAPLLPRRLRRSLFAS